MALLRNLSDDLRFLDGRTERYESASVRVEAGRNSVTVRIGEQERHTLTYHARDNTWTVSFYPRDQWLDAGIKTLDASALARRSFVVAVLYSLRACKQIGGMPMISPDEEARLLAR
jgi:hypothetical protein